MLSAHMNSLMQMSGIAATLLVCAILFAEECGVPLPFLPGDLLLAAGGLLAAEGHVNIVVFIAGTTLAMCAGALIGHGWSRQLGRPVLMRLATRLGHADRVERLLVRLRDRGWVGVLVCRLMPGMRVYTNLAAGIAAMRRRTFVAGLVPSVIAWTIGFSLLGLLVGHPATRAIRATEKAIPLALLVSGVALVVAIALRRVPGRGDRRRERPGTLRMLGAGLLDVAVAGAAAVVVLAFAKDAPLMRDLGGIAMQAVAVVGAVTLAYVAVARRSIGATAGEELLGVSYRRSRQHTPAG